MAGTISIPSQLAAAHQCCLRPATSTSKMLRCRPTRSRCSTRRIRMTLTAATSGGLRCPTASRSHSPMARPWSGRRSKPARAATLRASVRRRLFLPCRIASPPQGRGEMIAASALPADFPSAQLVVPKQVMFKSEDGLEIHGQLFVPAGRTQPGPALIFMHGGPIRQMMLGFHYMDYYHNAYAMNQYLASQGYVVLSVNYRLGIMYGRAFREAAEFRLARGVRVQRHHRRSALSADVADGRSKQSSACGAAPTEAISRRWDWRATPTCSRRVLISTACMTGRCSCRVGTPTLPQHLTSRKPGSWRFSLRPMPRYSLEVSGAVDSGRRRSQCALQPDRRSGAAAARRIMFRSRYWSFPDEIHDFLMYKTWVKAYGATADFFHRYLQKP